MAAMLFAAAKPRSRHRVNSTRFAHSMTEAPDSSAMGPEKTCHLAYPTPTHSFGHLLESSETSHPNIVTSYFIKDGAARKMAWSCSSCSIILAIQLQPGCFWGQVRKKIQREEGERERERERQKVIA